MHLPPNSRHWKGALTDTNIVLLRVLYSQHMGILFAHARDEWNNLSSAPFLIFERAAAGF